MNINDKAAHAIVVVARHYGVDPLMVPGAKDAVRSPNLSRARVAAAMLLAEDPDFNSTTAAKALGVGAPHVFLSKFRGQMKAGGVPWYTADVRIRLREAFAEIVFATPSAETGEVPEATAPEQPEIEPKRAAPARASPSHSVPPAQTRKSPAPAVRAPEPSHALQRPFASPGKKSLLDMLGEAVRNTAAMTPKEEPS